MIKHSVLLKIQNMMDIKGDLLQWLIICFIKKTSGGAVKNENISSQELAEKLHKLIIRKFEKRKVYSIYSLVVNIWGADLTDMKLISKFNKGICFLLCVIDIFSKNA